MASRSRCGPVAPSARQWEAHPPASPGPRMNDGGKHKCAAHYRPARCDEANPHRVSPVTWIRDTLRH
jgi:hypothetical protein